MSISPTLSFDQIIRIHYMVLKAGLNQYGMNQDFTKMGTISSILIQHWHKKVFFFYRRHWLCDGSLNDTRSKHYNNIFGKLWSNSSTSGILNLSAVLRLLESNTHDGWVTTTGWKPRHGLNLYADTRQDWGKNIPMNWGISYCIGK